MSGAWSDLGDGVRVRRSRAWEMNSTLLARDGAAVLVDPGVLPSELADLAGATAAVAPRAADVTLVFTHPHWDHVLGRAAFPRAATLAHADFAPALARAAADVERKARAWIEGAGEAWPGPFAAFAPDRAVRGTTALRLGPFAAVAYELPGHCPAQIGLHFPEPGVFVAADTLSEIEIPWLDGPPAVYRRALEALAPVFADAPLRVLVPGHGPVAHGREAARARLARDLDYLRALEARVADAVGRGLAADAVRRELATMDYPGRDAAYPMNDVHAANVQYAHAAVAAAAAEPRRT